MSGVGGLDVAEVDERSERCEKIEDALLDIEGLAICGPSTRVLTSYGFSIVKFEYSFELGGESVRGGRVPPGGEIPLLGSGNTLSMSSIDGCLCGSEVRVPIVNTSAALANGAGRTFDKFVDDLFFMCRTVADGDLGSPTPGCGGSLLLGGPRMMAGKVLERASGRSPSIFWLFEIVSECLD